MNAHLKRLALIILVLGSAGCFRYVPADINTTPPGEGVRLLVTREGAAEFSSVAIVNEAAPTIDGTIVGMEGSELLVSVPVGQRQDGFLSTSLNQTIRVPSGEIVAFQRREFDRAATSLFIAGGAGIIAGIVTFIVRPRRGDIQNPEDPPDDLGLAFNLFSIPLGR